MSFALQPNPETVEALLDTTWHIVTRESDRTDALDRKASTLATFASLLTSLTATLGVRFLDQSAAVWALALFCAGLAALVLCVGLAVYALLPTEHLTLGADYLERFPTWSEVVKAPIQVRGETMRGLIAAIARERSINDGKAGIVRRAFLALLAGLLLIAAEAATLAGRGVLA